MKNHAECRKRGVGMKIRAKLIIFSLFILIIPIVIIASVSKNMLESSSFDLLTSNIEHSIGTQAENINFFCERVASRAKNFAMMENVVEYVESTLEEGYEFDSSDPGCVTVMDEMEYFNSYGDNLVEAAIVNNAGIVVASYSDGDKIGRRVPNYKDMFDSALRCNGFSGFSISDSNGGQSPVFTVCRIIYGADNSKIGVFSATYDSAYIQKYLNGMKMDKYTVVAIMDGNGGILEYPFKSVKNCSESKNYSDFSEHLSKITAGASTDKFLNCLTDSPDGGKCIFVSPVSNSGWYMVAATDKKGMTGFIKNTCTQQNVLAAVLIVLCMTAVVIFSGKFLRPVRNIIEVMKEKSKGNPNARFDIRTKDEFREIGTAFNSMFDNIFESEQRYRTIVEMTNNITFEINFKKNTVFVSKNFNKKFSFRPKDDSLKESFIFKLRVHKDDRERYLSDVDKILGPANFIQGEYRVKSIYGDFIWVMLKATKFFDRNESPTKIVGVIVDIDREKKSSMHLLQRASYDNLTQLFNRETFIKSLANRIEATAVKKSLDAVMFIDLDDFKHFNDEFGHACGDEVLKFVADTLKEISFERGFAGRFGGDEFVLCITGLTLYGDSGKIAQEILDILGAGFISESTGNRLSIKCSIGIAFIRESGKTTEEILAAADEAMYNIKKFGKSAYSYAKSVSKDGKTPPDGVNGANGASSAHVPDENLLDTLF